MKISEPVLYFLLGLAASGLVYFGAKKVLFVEGQTTASSPVVVQTPSSTQ